MWGRGKRELRRKEKAAQRRDFCAAVAMESQLKERDEKMNAGKCGAG